MDISLKIDLLNRQMAEMINTFAKMKVMKLGQEWEGDSERRWQRPCESEVKLSIDGS